MHSPTLSTAVRRIRAVAAPLTDSLSDRELLARFLKTADDSAFAMLVERHGPSVFGVCRRILTNNHDAEDAFQATFLVLARRAASIRNTAAIGCWLHGVAFRVANKLKSRRARQADAAELPDVAAPSHDDVSWREVRCVLDDELNRLPERLRLPVFLCYFEGKTRDEAAESLGWKLTTLRGRLEDGRERLRVRLARRGIELSAALLAISAATDGVADNLLQLAVRAANGNASTAASALAKGVVASNGLGKLALSMTIVAAIGLGTTLLAFRGQAGDKPNPGTKPSDPPAKKNELPKELLALMNAADRVWVVDEPAAKTPVPEPAEILKGMSPPDPGYSFRFNVEALKDLPRKGNRWIVFLKSVEEVDHLPKLSPLAGERWYIPADDTTIAALRDYVPPCEWGETSNGLRLGLHVRSGADEPTVEVVMQNVSEKNIHIQQFRGNYWDDWSALSFTITSPIGKTYTLERFGPPLKDGDGPRDRVLKPGERYIHVVRLNRWLTPTARDRGFDLPHGNAPAGLFATGGDFKVQATYKLTDGRDEPRWWIGKIESKPVTVSVPKLGVFGEKIGDFQLRLRPPSGALRVGDLHALVCDLKHSGKEKRSVHLAPDFAAVELDGKWYRCGRDGSIEGRTVDVAADGELLSCLDVRPDSNWIHLREKPDADDPSIKEAVQFQLKAGTHTIRVAYTFAKDVRAISNAITIDVGSDGWGELAAGLKSRLRLARTKYEPGDQLSFELDVKNVGRKAATLTPIPVVCDIQIDDRWYMFHGSIESKEPPKELKPGEEVTAFIKVDVDSRWKTPKRNQDPGDIDETEKKKREFLDLRLGEGFHKVRVAIPVNNGNATLTSNAVDIEVAAVKLGAKVRAMAMEADRIWVVRAPTQDIPIPLAEQVLKGPMAPESRIFDLRLLPGDDPKKKFIVFLRWDESSKGAPEISILNRSDWYMPYTKEAADAISKLLLPDEWGDEKSGLRMGLRLRKSTVAIGQPIVVEIVVQNNGKQDWTLAQHRFNIYDYWPDTHFKVKSPDGKIWELRKPVGPIREDDSPRAITLKPGESYIQAVSLDTWPAHTDWRESSEPLKNLFAKEGEYTITAHYRYSPPIQLGTWTADFATAPTKLRIEKADDWGASVADIKTRLRLAKAKFKEGEPLEFDLDLKNVGQKTIIDSPVSYFCHIELDGDWYEYKAPLSVITAETELKAGNEYASYVKVSTDKSWQFVPPFTDTGGGPKEAKTLELKPGKHKVRVSYPIAGKEATRVTSQAIEFEVEGK